MLSRRESKQHDASKFITSRIFFGNIRESYGGKFYAGLGKEQFDRSFRGARATLVY